MNSSSQVLDSVAETWGIFSLVIANPSVWQEPLCLLHSCSLTLHESALENSYLTTTGKEREKKKPRQNPQIKSAGWV